jgi:hypothetical protein
MGRSGWCCSKRIIMQTSQFGNLRARVSAQA